MRSSVVRPAGRPAPPQPDGRAPPASVARLVRQAHRDCRGRRVIVAHQAWTAWMVLKALQEYKAPPASRARRGLKGRRGLREAGMAPVHRALKANRARRASRGRQEPRGRQGSRVSVGRLGRLELMVHAGLQGLQEHEGQPERTVLRGLQGLTGLMVHGALPVHRGQLERLVHAVNRGQWGHKARRGLLELTGRMVRTARRSRHLVTSLMSA